MNRDAVDQLFVLNPTFGGQKEDQTRWQPV
jgi:hypothetical protein